MKPCEKCIKNTTSEWPSLHDLLALLGICLILGPLPMAIMLWTGVEVTTPASMFERMNSLVAINWLFNFLTALTVSILWARRLYVPKLWMFVLDGQVHLHANESFLRHSGKCFLYKGPAETAPEVGTIIGLKPGGARARFIFPDGHESYTWWAQLTETEGAIIFGTAGEWSILGRERHQWLEMFDIVEKHASVWEREECLREQSMIVRAAGHEVLGLALFMGSKRAPRGPAGQFVALKLADLARRLGAKPLSETGRETLLSEIIASYEASQRHPQTTEKTLATDLDQNPS